MRRRRPSKHKRIVRYGKRGRFKKKKTINQNVKKRRRLINNIVFYDPLEEQRKTRLGLSDEEFVKAYKRLQQYYRK